MFAREGAAVAINYLPEEQADAETTRREIEKHGSACLLVPGDVSEPNTCDDLVETAVRHFGAIDVLVSNSAYQRRKKTLEDLDDAQLEYTFSTNFFAYVRLARAALRHMKPGSAIIAPAYVFLASNADSSYITGIVLQVMGGETAGG